MSSLGDESIILEFVAESREHLGHIEPDLLSMEEQGDRTPGEVINRVFRAIHSIKGGAGFFAFERLKGLSHAMESVLMLVRDKKLSVTAEVMDVVFASLDRLKAMLDDIQESETVPCDEELASLQKIMEGQGVKAGATVKAKDEGGLTLNLDAEDVRSAIRRGMTIYHVQAYLHQDIAAQGLNPLSWLNNAMSLGTCLDAYIDVTEIADLDRCLDQDLKVTLLFGTVLEPDLAAIGLKVPVAQLKAMDMKALKRQLQKDAAPPTPTPAPAPAPAPLPTANPEPQGEDRGAKLPKEAGPETLRVRVDLLTNLMNLAGELVLGRNQLLRAVGASSRSIPGLPAILMNINQVTSEMQEGIMQTRMQPIGTVFTRFPRIVRDMARTLGKQIEVHIKGAEVELDKSIVELLADPLTHIIRNCADHALEPPEERAASGKAATGTITLDAYHEGGQVHITIRDDGRGIDARKVAAKAVSKGLLTQAQADELSDREAVHLIFAPGFSTADQISDISGRGVGMDVVKTNAEKLGGRVDVETVLGQGTTVRLQLPLTLAIIPSMIVGVGAQRFAIPQVSLVEFVWVKAAEVAARIEQLQGAEVLRLRDHLLPLVRLADLLGLHRAFETPDGEVQPDRRHRLSDRRSASADTRQDRPDRRQNWRGDHNIVVLRNGPHLFAVVVDALFDIEEIVVKPLASLIQDVPCFSGATILGDGRVVMILDAAGLARQASLAFSDLQAEARQRKAAQAKASEDAFRFRKSVVLFRSGPTTRFAMPQAQILRIERVDPASLERVGETEYVAYRGSGLPVVRLEQRFPVDPMERTANEAYLLIPKLANAEGRPPAGLLISEVLDALDVQTHPEPLPMSGPGLLGGAMIQGHLTLFLDAPALLGCEGGKA